MLPATPRAQRSAMGDLQHHAKQLGLATCGATARVASRIEVRQQQAKPHQRLPVPSSKFTLQVSQQCAVFVRQRERAQKAAMCGVTSAHQRKDQRKICDDVST